MEECIHIDVLNTIKKEAFELFLALINEYGSKKIVDSKHMFTCIVKHGKLIVDIADEKFLFSTSEFQRLYESYNIRRRCHMCEINDGYVESLSKGERIDLWDC